MRKAALFLTALAAIACSKTPTSPETPPTLEPEALKFDIRVADLGDTDNTKAPKKGWEKGDILNIWFDNWRGYSGDYTGISEMLPQFMIQYDGSKWNIFGYPSEITITQLNKEGFIAAVYEGTNNTQNYSVLVGDKTGNPRTIWFHPKYVEVNDTEGGFTNKHKIDIRPMQAYTDYNGSVLESSIYKFDKAANTLSVTVRNWVVSTRLRVLVKNDDNGLTGDAADWCMQVIDETNNKYPDTKASIAFRIYNPSTYQTPIAKDRAALKVGTDNQYRYTEKGYTIGVKEGNDVAFYYDSLSATNATIKFRLINVKTGETKSYTVTDKTLEDNGKCTGIALIHSRFE
mgnify:FL=1